jgi:PAS domain S-box-containing protein
MPMLRRMANAPPDDRQFDDILKRQLEFSAGKPRATEASESSQRAIPGLDPSILQILDALPFYVLLVDRNHRILLINRAARDILKADTLPILGGYCPKIVHGKDEPIAECPLEEAVKTGRSCTREIYSRENGRWFESMVFGTEYRPPDGGVAYLHLIRDITERKQAEQSLVEQERRLEEAVEERTAELKKTMAEVKVLGGLLPICASCKKIRDDKGYWNQLESYIQEHSGAEFTHGLCPDCVLKLYPDFVAKDPAKKD